MLNYTQLHYLTPPDAVIKKAIMHPQNLHMASEETYHGVNGLHQQEFWMQLHKLGLNKLLHFHQNKLNQGEYKDFLREYRPLFLMLKAFNYAKSPQFHHSLLLNYNLILNQYPITIFNHHTANFLSQFAIIVIFCFIYLFILGFIYLSLFSKCGLGVNISFFR